MNARPRVRDASHVVKQAAHFGLGQLVVGLRNTMGIARAIAGREALGLPMSTMDSVKDDYASLTKADIDAAIDKHMQVDKAVTVVAGSIQ